MPFDSALPPVTIDNVGSCPSIAHEPAKEKDAASHRISDKTVRFIVGEENAKVLDARNAMGSVAARSVDVS